MRPITDDELARIERMLAKATPGPWGDFIESGQCWIETANEQGEPTGDIITSADDMTTGDQLLIGEAPQMIRRLLDEVYRLRLAPVSDQKLADYEKLIDETTPGQWYPRATDDDYCMSANYVGLRPDPTHPRWSHDGGNGMAPGSMDGEPPDQVIAITLLQTPPFVYQDQCEENTVWIARSREIARELMANLRRAQEVANQAISDLRGLLAQTDDKTAEAIIHHIADNLAALLPNRD